MEERQNDKIVSQHKIQAQITLAHYISLHPAGIRARMPNPRILLLSTSSKGIKVRGVHSPLQLLRHSTLPNGYGLISSY